jgi:shikimate kinase/3-dehydroquinate synthase
MDAPRSLPGLARTLALSGPMGAGKSTVGPRLAERLGVPFVDSDALVAQRTGMTVGEAFRALGEPAFRALEGELIAPLLADGRARVLSLGGGTVTHTPTRRALLRDAIVVTLLAPAEALVARLSAQEIDARPRLADAADRVGALAEMIASRAAAYAEAHAVLDARRPIDELVAEASSIGRADPVAVGLGERSYRVDLGDGALAAFVGSAEANALLGARAVLVSDVAIWAALAEHRDVASLAAHRSFAPVVLLPSGEEHKGLAAVERIWDAALDAGVDRKGAIVALGGGVVGDVAGFAAATLLRGVRVVQVPTTLLAMVDASVGGKTAIDRAQGKNLVGAFHQPSRVVADTSLLATLPPRQLRAGLAEVVKTAVLEGEGFLAMLEADADALLAGDRAALRRAIRRSIVHKASVVADDERETGTARAALNLGHTLGHAFEAEGGYARLTHGEAVAIGMVAALDLGLARGVGTRALRDRVVHLLARLGLPHDWRDQPLAAALPWIASDKKREGAHIRFILIERPGAVRIERLAPAEIAASLASIR